MMELGLLLMERKRVADIQLFVTFTNSIVYWIIIVFVYQRIITIVSIF